MTYILHVVNNSLNNIWSMSTSFITPAISLTITGIGLQEKFGILRKMIKLKILAQEMTCIKFCLKIFEIFVFFYHLFSLVVKELRPVSRWRGPAHSKIC